MPGTVLHQLKEISGGKATTSCGQSVGKAQTTAWWREVTCAKCKYSGEVQTQSADDDFEWT